MAVRQYISKISLEWLRYISAYLILTYGTRKLIGGGQFALGPALGSRPIGSLSGFGRNDKSPTLDQGGAFSFVLGRVG